MSSGSVISGSNLIETNSWLIEHACNDPQGSTKREEYIVREKYREKRDLREKILSCICGAVELCFTFPLSYNRKHSSMDVTSILEVNHVKTCVMQLVYVLGLLMHCSVISWTSLQFNG